MANNVSTFQQFIQSNPTGQSIPQIVTRLRDNIQNVLDGLGVSSLLSGLPETNLNLDSFQNTLDTVVSLANQVSPETLLEEVGLEGIGDSANSIFNTLGLDLTLDEFTRNVLNNALSSFGAPLGELTNFISNIRLDRALESVSEFVQNQIIIPEAIFLAAILVLYAQGGDPTYENRYLRFSIAIPCDLILVFNWLNEIDTGYSYSVRNLEREIVLSSENSAIRVLEKLLAITQRMIDSLSNNTDPNTMNLSQSTMTQLRRLQYVAFKNIVVFGYTNVDLSKIISIVERYNLRPNALSHPSVPYDREFKKEFGNEFAIRNSDLDIMVPVEMPGGGSIEVITPRNQFIKKIYLYLTSFEIFGGFRLIHAPLHRRLEKIYSVNYVPSNDTTITNTPKTNSSIYEYAKSNKPLLYNPRRSTFFWASICRNCEWFYNGIRIFL